jgi:hypothetical protein
VDAFVFASCVLINMRPLKNLHIALHQHRLDASYVASI